MIPLRYTAAALFARTNAFVHFPSISGNSSPIFPRYPLFRLARNSDVSTSNSNHQDDKRTFPLPFTELPYRGASFDISSLSNPSSDKSILDQLSLSLPILTEDDFNSVWLRIPLHRSAMVASASERLGFELHHVDPCTSESGGTIVMKKWLREGRDDKIPPYPNTQVGCAGLVLSDDNELLLVKEWSGPMSNRTQSANWKLPGGLLDSGESFAQASTREVFEETGVECDYESLLTLWHRHNLAMHNISDIYVVCLLRPKTKSVAGVGDPAEISDCCWMPVEEFLRTQNHPLITRILETTFGLAKRGEVGEKGDDEDSAYYASLVRSMSGGARLKPRVVLKEHDVQFGNRPVIPTYVGVTVDSSGSPDISEGSVE